MKRKVKEVNQKRINPIMKTHLNGKNLFLGISVIEYSATFLNWTKEVTKKLERWTCKQLIAGKVLHPKLDVMRVYIKRRCG